MDSRFFFKQVLPRVPWMIQLTVAHSLGLLETSSKWDLKSTLLVRFIRDLLAGDPPSSISIQQAVSLKDPGILGPAWASKVSIPKILENDDVLAKFLAVVDETKSKGAIYDKPVSEPVTAEWTGWRDGVKENEPAPKGLSELEVYEKMMQETKSDVTILYIHGGGLYLMDPASHRPLCARLGKLTGGRCLSVRYRLAPKYPFPAALLDVFTAYLYLLSPPAGSFHKPVPASKIVFCGDSAGGNLSFALLQLLLQLHRSAPAGQIPTVRFQGQEIPVPLPAGVACSSAWLDLTRAMPSIAENARWDYLPPPSQKSLNAHFPPCALWPVDPPREDLYCDGTMLTHPLVSPLAAASAAWAGSPPAFLFYGQEMLTDEGKYFARKLARACVPIQWDEFEAMPHCFPMVLQGSPPGKLALELWSDFIVRVVKGESVETRGMWYDANTLKSTVLDVKSLGELTDAQVEGRMLEDVRRKEGFAKAAANGAVKAKL